MRLLLLLLLGFYSFGIKFDYSGVRITKTSHLAERTIASDTEPIKKRSTALSPKKLLTFWVYQSVCSIFQLESY